MGREMRIRHEMSGMQTSTVECHEDYALFWSKLCCNTFTYQNNFINNAKSCSTEFWGEKCENVQKASIILYKLRSLLRPSEKFVHSFMTAVISSKQNREMKY